MNILNDKEMKKILSSLIVIFLSLIMFSFTNLDKGNCSLLHEGTFNYEGIENEAIKVVIKKTKHIGYHSNGKYVIESELKWVNECEYNMTMTKITIPDFPYQVGDIMNVKVNKITGKEIFYTSTVNGKSWKGKLIKLN
jgi:hypothetical protein